MDNNALIQNIIKYCEAANVAPTVACKESGVGKDLIANMKKGKTPSVAKVADLAHYLGVTTSELLGETLLARPFTEPELDDQIRKLMEGLSPEDFAQALVIARAIKESKE